MIAKTKTFEITMNRTIPASPDEAFDAWLDPANPGTPWNNSEKLVLEPKVGKLFYFRHVMEGVDLPHFGCFTALDRAKKIQYTWMSRHTRGTESIVTITLQKKGADTLLSLNHAGLPDDEMGHAHEGGWNHYLGIFEGRFVAARA
ncbi:MAG TPA: SRPBCC domain-containing protein [Usitatibacter sp.]|jgi:uncharacterized protein YndB with AHSA1/START domain|nr:SRPBCC domain-containing protein [Usitatibacter sp.]